MSSTKTDFKFASTGLCSSTLSDFVKVVDKRAVYVSSFRVSLVKLFVKYLKFRHNAPAPSFDHCNNLRFEVNSYLQLGKLYGVLLNFD